MGHGHAAVVDGGGEAGYVGHHSPAHAHHEVGPGEPELSKPAAQLLDRGQAFRLLTVANEERALLRARLDGNVDARLGDDRHPPGPGRHHRAQGVPGAGTDQHRVRPRPQVDRNLADRRLGHKLA